MILVKECALFLSIINLINLQKIIMIMKERDYFEVKDSYVMNQYMMLISAFLMYNI